MGNDLKMLEPMQSGGLFSTRTPQVRVTLSDDEGLLQKAKKTFSKGFQKLKEGVKKVFGTQTATAEETKTVTASAVVKSEEEIAIEKLSGQLQCTVDTVRDMMTATGLSIVALTKTVHEMSKFSFSFPEILGMRAADLQAVYLAYKVGSLTSSSAELIYEKLDEGLRIRFGVWLQEAWPGGFQTLVYAGAAAPPRTRADYEQILKYYTRVASERLPEKEHICLRLCKFCLFLTTGIIMPRIQTMYLATIWLAMMTSMLSNTSFDRPEILGGMAMAIAISLTIHLAAGEIGAISNFIVGISKKGWHDMPEKMKSWVRKALEGVGVDVDAAKHYLNWNKSFGVLLEKPSLSYGDSMRSISTFSFGESCVNLLTGQPTLKSLLKGLSPVPVGPVLHRLLSLFRDPGEYLRRVDRIFAAYDKPVQESPERKQRLKYSFIVYRDVMKLRYAYIPENEHGLDGDFYDSGECYLSGDLVNEIAGRHYIHAKSAVVNEARYVKYILDLRRVIMKNADPSYWEFFGEPRRKLFRKVHYAQIAKTK